MAVSKNRGILPPKWMVKIMEKPIKFHDLGYHYFWKHPLRKLAFAKRKGAGTWRIIPLSKWLVTMVSKSLKWSCSPSKWPKWLINGGY